MSDVILYLKNSRGYHLDVVEALNKRGCQLKILEISDANETLLKSMAERKHNYLWEAVESSDWNILFTLDYYPCLATLCNTLNKIYVSWSLEPSFFNLYSTTIAYSTNRVFVADKWVTELLRKEGIQHVFYLPEGVNVERCQRMKGERKNLEKEFPCSLIGDCVNLSWQELFRAELLRDSTLGYMEGMLAGQNLIYGVDFFERNLPEYVMKDLLEASHLRKPVDSVQSIMQYYAEQCFYPKTTAVDRIVAAKCLAKVGTMHLYGNSAELVYEGVDNHKNFSYEDILGIIDRSKVNVSIAPRGFKDGIYGHALQIMGMGGFLITDYRKALYEEFEPGKDFVVYDDMLHLMESAAQYLKDEDAREQIARNGQAKILQSHTLEKRLGVIEAYL